MTTVKFSDIVTFAWSYTSSRCVDMYRNAFSEAITITTKSGPVKGYKIPSAFDFHYYNFCGIPYAKPPIGDLRFKDPQPFEPASEVINHQYARHESLACQNGLISHRPIGNENCLHLNVYSLDVIPDKLKPVMLWIHGGAFIMGSNSKEMYNPELLLRNDVVVICINYRLGAFGFLSLKDPELGIPGNAGLKDQVMAMQWVKDNCKHFGGDPENITLFGESAGGASVSFHAISNMSKGLFEKAICMSGTATAPWALSPIKDWTYRLARKLGWNGDGGDKACLDVLQLAHSDAIIKAQDALLTTDDRKKHVLFPFGAVIEPFKSAQCFLAKEPKQLMENAWSKNVPMIIGCCSDEGLLFHRLTMKKPSILSKINLGYLLPIFELGLDVDSEQCHQMAEELRKFYFGFSTVSAETVMVYLMILNDKLFQHPMHQTIVARHKSHSAPTYMLRFNFDSSYSFTKTMFAGRNIPGVCHADDLAYYFKSVYSGLLPSHTSDEWKTIERMTELFTTFAKTGDPNNDVIAPIQWKPTAFEKKDNRNVYKCLNIAKEVTFIDSPEIDRLHYWDKLMKSTAK